MDLWAHLWGFVAGGGAGICAALFVERPETAGSQLGIGMVARGRGGAVLGRGAGIARMASHEYGSCITR